MRGYWYRRAARVRGYWYRRAARVRGYWYRRAEGTGTGGKRGSSRRRRHFPDSCTGGGEDARMRDGG
ncbi:hypothetical protein NDU88_000326 [Pleurodeles waltl]|uniref:Uncharacterized protein n=1 Tax=Pleurodeles waltl TaxID=8319 RepID=A0AAV7R3Y5_PLEWA|nr:hypothetical protein NDU88_000326 [Pleurodeles waltl]